MPVSYFQRCRKAYQRLTKDPVRRVPIDITRFTFRIVQPYCQTGKSDSPFCWTPDLVRSFKKLARVVSAKLNDPAQIQQEPGFEDGPYQRLKTGLDLPMCHTVVTGIATQLEQYFQTFFVVDRIAIYRLQVINNSTNEIGPMSWHIDGFPNEYIKVLFYLDDVQPGVAAFRLLQHPTGRVMKILTNPMTERNWRPFAPTPGVGVPREYLTRQLDRGYAETPIYGQKGTAVVFGPNCIHGATAALKRKRDTLTVRFRPTEAPTPHSISPEQGL